MATTNAKEQVRLRQRRMKSGRVSLYLDIYIKGDRSYEYLGLYLTEERNRSDRERNRQTLELAEAVKAKRVVEIRNGIFGFDNGRREDWELSEYFKDFVNGKREAGLSASTCRITEAALDIATEYNGRRRTTMRSVTQDWCRGFVRHLDRAKSKIKGAPLSQNSKALYLGCVKGCFRKALEDGIIQTDPFKGVKGFKGEETEKVYLTTDEVRAMAAAKCECGELKRAFLFSCLTGMRKSDIQRLTWGQVRQHPGGVRIVFRQKKTNGQEYTDINQEATLLLGERRGDADRVFKGFYYSNHALRKLREWASSCGISKHVTFHTGRHTFAVSLLESGADIFTVQKLLGHRELRTTMVYADISDHRKREAVDRLPSVLQERPRKT